MKGQEVSTQETHGASSAVDLERHPAVAAQVASAPNHTSHRQSHKPELFLAFIGIISITIIVGICYLLIAKPFAVVPTTIDTLVASTKFASSQALVDKVQPTLRGKVMVVSGADGVGAVNDRGYGVYSAPAYKAPGAKFSNQPQAASGAGYIGDNVTARKNYNTLVKFFETNKFRRIVSTAGTEGPVSSKERASYLSYAEYESSDLVCAIRNVDASATNLNAFISSIGCADKRSYAKAAESLRPFYNAYISNLEEKVSGDIIFGPLSIQQVDGGYERVLIYQEDASQFDSGETAKAFWGFYYRKVSDQKWTYFTGILTDDMLTCEKYDSNTLRAAFKGIECVDASGQQTTL